MSIQDEALHLVTTEPGLKIDVITARLGVTIVQAKDALHRIRARGLIRYVRYTATEGWYTEAAAPAAVAEGKRLASLKNQERDRIYWQKRAAKLAAEQTKPFVHRRVSKWRPLSALPGPRNVFELAR